MALAQRCGQCGHGRCAAPPFRGLSAESNQSTAREVGNFRALARFFAIVLSVSFLATTDKKLAQAAHNHPRTTMTLLLPRTFSASRTTFATMMTTTNARAPLLSLLRSSSRSSGVTSTTTRLTARRSFSEKATAATAPLARRKGLIHLYMQSIQKRPLLTKTGMAAIIFFTSDSATQYLLRDKKAEFSWDAPRALSGATFGVVATTWLHYWWGFLEVAVGARFPVTAAAATGTKVANTAIKVFLDQAIGAPLYIFTYYVLTNFGQSLDPREQTPDQMLSSFKTTTVRAADMLWPTMLQHWKLWPAVHCVNFYFMPLHHRVLVQNTVLVGWSGYLSHLNNGGLMTPEEEIKVAIVRRNTETESSRKATAAAAAATATASLATSVPPVTKQA